jgi:hypothetical protein
MSGPSAVLTASEGILISEVEAMIERIKANVSAAGVVFLGLTSAYDNASEATSALATLEAIFPMMKSHVAGATVVSVSGGGVTPAFLSSMVISIYGQGGGGRVDTVTLTTNNAAYTSGLVAEVNAGRVQGFSSAREVETGPDESDVPVGAIIGGVVAGAVVIALVLMGIVWVYKRKTSDANFHMEDTNSVMMVEYQIDTASLSDGHF